MKQIIDNLNAARVDIARERNSTCKMSGRQSQEYLDHGSIEQTRDILFESMFEQSISAINTAIAQLEILNRNLY